MPRPRGRVEETRAAVIVSAEIARTRQGEVTGRRVETTEVISTRRICAVFYGTAQQWSAAAAAAAAGSSARSGVFLMRVFYISHYYILKQQSLIKTQRRRRRLARATRAPAPAAHRRAKSLYIRDDNIITPRASHARGFLNNRTHSTRVPPFVLLGS